MAVEDRITYDPDELIGLMERELDRLKVFQFDSRYRLLLGDAFLDKLSAWERDIRRRKEDPFTIVVCGEFKRGKSSLINALLGEEATPINVTTETVTLNRISYGGRGNEAVLSGGRRIRLADEELLRESLERLAAQLGEPIKQVEIRRPAELLREATIVDTPGLGDSLRDFSSLVEEALAQADAVIYLFSVNYPLSQSEQMFLRTMIVPQKYTELLLVGNYADMLSGREDYERMKALLAGRIQGLLPDQEPWLLSALDERCRQTEESRPNPAMEDILEEGFDRFRARISSLIEEKREMVLPDRMERMFRGMLDSLEGDLAALEQGLTMTGQDVRENLERVRAQKEGQIKAQEETDRKIDEMIAQMQAQASEWLEELLDRLRREAGELSDMAAADLTKYYSFYCIDVLQEAIGRCQDYHMLLLCDELEGIAKELTEGLSREAVSQNYGFRFALDNKTWTKGDNVSFVVSKIDSLGLLSLVADGVAGAMRQKEMANKTPDILKAIEAQYSGLYASVRQAVEGTYRQMGTRIKKQLADYYGDKIREAEKLAEQSAMVARQDEAKKEEIREAIGQVRAVFAQMEKYQTRGRQ